LAASKRQALALYLLDMYEAIALWHTPLEHVSSPESVSVSRPYLYLLLLAARLSAIHSRRILHSWSVPRLCEFIKKNNKKRLRYVKRLSDLRSRISYYPATKHNCTYYNRTRRYHFGLADITSSAWRLFTWAEDGKQSSNKASWHDKFLVFVFKFGGACAHTWAL